MHHLGFPGENSQCVQAAERRDFEVNRRRKHHLKDLKGNIDISQSGVGSLLCHFHVLPHYLLSLDTHKSCTPTVRAKGTELELWVTNKF